jgi:hypothetical protein
LYGSDNKEYAHFILRGPSNREFLDGDQISYYDVYVGTTFELAESGFLLQIWESDDWGGGPDVLFEEWISGPGLYYSRWAAGSDAVNNAYRRGANSWAPSVWQGGVQHGMPILFVQIGGDW